MTFRLKLQISTVAIGVPTCASPRSPPHLFVVNQVACDFSNWGRANCLHVVVGDDCRAGVVGEDVGRKGSLRERYGEFAAPRIPSSAVRLRLASHSPRPSS
jgi:hypothetical protein